MSILSRHETLPGFDGAAGWLNSEPLTPDGLRGKVVLVDFWTYTCINWLRTLGYVRAWAEKYKDQGLVVIGVHTPEFPFERDIDNVRWAAEEMRVEYPIALDPDYAVWRAFSNHYWPAVYIADAEGRIQYHHFGEGAYDESERVIQRLLGIEDGLVSVASAQWGNHLETWPADHLHVINKRLVLEFKNPTGNMTPRYMKVLDKLVEDGLCESSTI